MNALLKKELGMYFGTRGAYLVAIIFNIVASLFLWFLTSNYNIFEIGNANALSFFQLAPWLLLFLIPALTMRSFAEEYTLGTLQWLFSKPLHLRSIISSKYISTLLVIAFCLLPSLVFMYSIYQLSLPVGNVDLKVIFSSYLGLIFLSGAFISVGLLSSILTKNMVYAYLIALFINFLFYFGFEGIATFDMFGTWDLFIKRLGFSAHYLPFTIGLVDTRDIFYFLFIILAFQLATYVQLKKYKN